MLYNGRFLRMAVSRSSVLSQVTREEDVWILEGGGGGQIYAKEEGEVEEMEGMVFGLMRSGI